MDTIVLPFVHILSARLAEKAPLLQFILGPRQVGKTTGVEQAIKKFHGDVHYYLVEGDLRRDHFWIREVWDQAFRSEGSLLVIDEIQKIDNWSETVKSLWDQSKKKKKSMKCIFLGSSSLSLYKGLSESLAGRYESIIVPYWNFSTSKKLLPTLSFSDYLLWGGYPGAYAFAKDSARIKGYIRNSIVGNVVEKDILLNHTVKKPALFRQLTELLSAYPSQEISYTKILGQLQESGNVELVKYYLQLLDSAYLFRTIEKFSGSQVKQKLSSPKILPGCPALCFGLGGGADTGRIFEMIVGQQLLQIADRVFYWREGNAEVDFIAKIGRKIFAVEVKSGFNNSDRPRSSKSMSNFCKRYPNIQPLWIDPKNYLELEKNGIDFILKA